MQPSCSEWKSETCPSLCPDFKGQMKKAENVLASFCSDVRILEWIKRFLCLHLFTTAERKEEQSTSLASMRGELWCPCSEHRVTEMKTCHTSALGFGKDLIVSALPALGSPSGVLQHSWEVTWFVLQWHRCCQFCKSQEQGIFGILATWELAEVFCFLPCCAREIWILTPQPWPLKECVSYTVGYSFLIHTEVKAVNQAIPDRFSKAS